MPVAVWGELEGWAPLWAEQEEAALEEGDGGEEALSGLEAPLQPSSTASSEVELHLFWESLVICVFVIDLSQLHILYLFKWQSPQ